MYTQNKHIVTYDIFIYHSHIYIGLNLRWLWFCTVQNPACSITRLREATENEAKVSHCCLATYGGIQINTVRCFMCPMEDDPLKGLEGSYGTAPLICKGHSVQVSLFRRTSEKHLQGSREVKCSTLPCALITQQTLFWRRTGKALIHISLCMLV